MDPRTLNLVPLSTLPRPWAGLAVYHPMLQKGGVPYWHTSDYTGVDAELLEPDERDEYSYDTGVVVDTFTLDGDLRVRFDCGGYTLHYSPTNLWVRRENK